jgi:hypothetical protein
MHFESSPITLLEAIFSLAGYAVGAFLLHVTYDLWTGWNFMSIFVAVIFSGLAGIFIYASWQAMLILEVDLSNNPREARCRRKNVITRLATRHRYKIPDNGKVFIQTGVGGKYHGNEVWPVRITGLPSYYNFFLLGRCRYNKVDDAYAIARTLAGFLGLPMRDHHGATRTIEGDGPYVWYPPEPDGHRGRKRRRRHG